MSISSSATFKDFLRSSLKWAYKRQRPDDHMFKNDDVELERQLIHHWTMQQGFGSMVTAPVNDILKGPGAKVLDIGCACGVWVMEMASAYPNATFIGLDNDSYVLPNNTMPKNAKFDLVDILLEKLPYPDCSFDLVFMRSMASYINRTQWEPVAKEIWRILKPGGWYENCDVNAHSYPQTAPHIHKWRRTNDAILNSRKNVDIYNIDTLPQRLPKYAPFTDITWRTVQFPVGSHGGDWGRLMLQNAAHLVGSSIRFSGVTDEQEVHQLARNIMHDVEKNEFFVPFTSMVARKSET